MTATERKSDFKLPTENPYLDGAVELWGVDHKDFEQKWPCYNGTALYVTI